MKIRVTGHSRFRRYLEGKRYILFLLIVVSFTALPSLTSDFYTKGEPREALVAQAMMQTGEYVLPAVYGGEVAYKPPMFHWLEVGVTLLTGGDLTPLSARLPSVLAVMGLSVVLFLFLAQRRSIPLALLASLLFLSALDPHRFSIIARVDMVLATFMVLALFSLYTWWVEERGVGLPWIAILLMSGAFLTKGPVGVCLPLLILFVFIITRRETWLRALPKLMLIGVLASLLPLIWYGLAWNKEGADFIQIVWNENILRFLGIKDETLFYDLGHEGPIYKPIIYFLLGFIPWIFVFFFIPWRTRLTTDDSKRDPLRQFAIIAAITTLLFYMMAMSKSSSYLLPMYPFASLIVADELFWLIRHRPVRLQAFAWLLMGIGFLFLTVLVSMHLGVSFSFIKGGDISVISESIRTYTGLTLFVELLLTVALLTILYQKIRGNNHKLAFSLVFLVFVLNFAVDGPAMKLFKVVNSAKPFAMEVKDRVGEEPLYVVTDLKNGIYNLYGLAFYVGNPTIDFVSHATNEGYMIAWEDDFKYLRDELLTDYHVDVLAIDSRDIKEGGRSMLLHFQHKSLDQSSGGRILR